jgi:hypothetical protein
MWRYPMSRRPAFLVAERAVRYLREAGNDVSSVRACPEVLALTSARSRATQLLTTAFGNDPRLAYDGGVWRLELPTAPSVTAAVEAYLRTSRSCSSRGRGNRRAMPLRLTAIAAVRRRGDTVVAAAEARFRCGRPARP